MALGRRPTCRLSSTHRKRTAVTSRSALAPSEARAASLYPYARPRPAPPNSCGHQVGDLIFSTSVLIPFNEHWQLVLSSWLCQFGSVRAHPASRELRLMARSPMFGAAPHTVSQSIAVAMP